MKGLMYGCMTMLLVIKLAVTVVNNVAAEEGSDPIRKTVSLHPFVEGMIRRHEAALLNKGWRNANFSLSLNMILLAMFFDHVTTEETLHRETIKQVNQVISGRLHLDEKHLEKWAKWTEKVASQPEASLYRRE
jgi:hypothetical protein